MKPQRPICRYHGGKWKLAPSILAYFPEHRVYVEPYGGGGSILLRKARSYAEVYNDLDGEMVNLFRMVRDRGAELKALLANTPFSREEYREAFEVCENPLETARRTMVRSFMGFGSNAILRSIKSGFRANSNRSGTTPAHDWCNYPECLDGLTDRLRGVVLENADAVKVMLQHDGEETLHYCDPPYVHSTRSATTTSHGARGYRHEMTDEQHAAFIEAVQGLRGYVVISGYACELYDDTLSDWTRVEIAAHADGARPRVEILWINQAAQQRMNECAAQQGLFA